MWWTIPLVMILLFIFVGIPLILDYLAEAKESSINERNNKKIIFINKGEIVMKSGDVVEARTHAEFLNKAFGTNYKAYMKCAWKYDEDWIVWMVRFNTENTGWINRFLSNSRIMEENTHIINISYIKPIEVIYKKRIVFEIVDLGYTRKYIYRGRFIYDEKNSNPYNVRYYDKYSD